MPGDGTAHHRGRDCERKADRATATDNITFSNAPELTR